MSRTKVKLKQISLAAVLIIIGLLLATPVTFARERERWTTPVQLSGENTKASEASLTVDSYGFVHVLWSEELESTRSIIQYARFDGQTWTKPSDFHITPELTPIGEVSSFIDDEDTLHIIWPQGFDQAIYYSHVPSQKAYSSTNWAKPIRLNFKSNAFRFIVDPQKTIHVLYTSVGRNRGIYYIRSKDQGETWSTPLWLDPDYPPGLEPATISFAMDDAGGMHAVWYYQIFEENYGDWLRYIHSFDGGETWSPPFTLSKNSEGDPGLNGFARPNIITTGQEVHIVWAGGNLLYRNHRFSTDRGKTWSNIQRNIFGGLNGQAGDGLAVDGLGRVHFFGQIRFPQGIHHSVWENGQWSPPVLIYLMAVDSTEGEYGEYVLAHRTFPAIRAGFQVILTFTDEPANANRRLFVMQSDLRDISLPVATISPTEIALAADTPEVVEPNLSTPTSTPAPSQVSQTSSGGASSMATLSDQPILFAIGPVLVILGLVLIVRFLNRRG